jgi:hypothetical protein
MAGLTVNNGAGCYLKTSSDPMYNTYIYPYPNFGDLTVTMTNLPAGAYDLLLYSPDGKFKLNVAGTDYGTKTCFDPSPTGVPVWQEGQQYARFDNVVIGEGEALTLTVQPGVSGYSPISGLQIMSVPEPSVAAILFAAALLLSFKNVSKSKLDVHNSNH